MPQWLRSALLLLIWTATSLIAASAHEVRPAYLELVETDPDTFSVVWKQPVRDGRRLRIDPVFPDTCVRGDDQRSAVGAALIQRWTLTCDLAGGTVSIAGLDRTLTDVFVRLDRLDEDVLTTVLRPGQASFDLSRPSGAGTSAYFRIGVEHIWFGFDHLLFVLGIMLLVKPRQLLGTITAFTVAHSITLALSALAGISLPGPPVEIVIALSIALLGVEVIYQLRGRASLASRRPWLIAALFGLVHGFGFAGALADIGLPKQSEVLALFLFNVGVEAGQIAIIAAVLALVWLIGRVRTIEATALRYAGAYALGLTGMYWAIERSVATFG